MKRLIILAPLALILASCSTAPASPTMAEARETCITAYRELPHSVQVLEDQSGEPADTATPCDNWIQSQGDDAFIDFWTTPTKYLPYVVNESKLEALAEAGFAD